MPGHGMTAKILGAVPAEMSLRLTTSHSGYILFRGATMKKALITGITGQDGSYLAELLIGKGMKCTGLSGVPQHSTQGVSTIFTENPHEWHKPVASLR